ncbi:hypothetical protein RhiirA4_458705 [Rhizophagus irregularis]|uniref:Uncharacterized protein n=1 Tax=Rhizophagus irregularis TaxID=588596 RepID=A0A2I1GCQ7_9GLOM|nr:hypothetical protein RhiirA4_458705 [Rhizophagus irregularis]
MDIQARLFNSAVNNSSLKPIENQITHEEIDWYYTRLWLLYNPTKSPTSDKLAHERIRYFIINDITLLTAQDAYGIPQTTTADVVVVVPFYSSVKWASAPRYASPQVSFSTPGWRCHMAFGSRFSLELKISYQQLTIQQPITKYGQSSKSIELGQQQICDRAVAKFFICCGVSFRLVEHPFIIDMVKSLCLGYNPPSARTL